MPANPRPRRLSPRRLDQLAARLAVPAPAGGATVVTGVSMASATVRPGDLFAAVPGARRHGGEFIAAARDAGAVAVLTDPAGVGQAAAAGLPVLVVADVRAAVGEVSAEVYGDPSRALIVLGLTGTAGKTSTAYLIESGLRAAGRVTGLIGSVETRLGDVRMDSAWTTPEAPELQAMLAVARERGVDAVVMEVSSHGLALDRVGGVRFAVGGWTNFGLDHLDFHADTADYFAAKARLFDGRCAHEVINLDDPALRPVLRPTTVTFSAAGDPAATWRAVDITGTDRQRFTLLGPAGLTLPAELGLPGRHNVANALLAIACLVVVGVDPATAAAGVAAVDSIPGRLERVPASGPVLGVVDYAHKPDSIVAVLAALREVSTARGGRLICVVGAGGDRDRGKRPLMGRAAAAGADLVLVTDDNPRTEDPGRIRSQLLAGAREVAGGAETVEVGGRRDAIADAVRRAAPGDVIALLGKGHERGQEIAGQTYPFDDRDELAAALRVRFAGVAGPGGAA